MYNKIGHINLIKRTSQSGFSLAEIIVVIVILAMLMTAVLSLYSSAQRSRDIINNKIAKSRLPREIVQCIAEDLDDIIGLNQIPQAQETAILVTNAVVDGHQSAKLEIIKYYYDNTVHLQSFETIIWQCDYDSKSSKQGLVLYRMHSTLIDGQSSLERASNEDGEPLFIPVCDGVTFFSVQVPDADDGFIDEWTQKKLPGAVTITLSFAPPTESADGQKEIYDEDKFVRTIAIDRVKKTRFTIFTDDNNQPNNAQSSQNNDNNMPSQNTANPSDPNDPNTTTAEDDNPWRR